MHYNPRWDLAFSSVESIMRDVWYGWLLRYIHANTASFFFIFMYIHIGRDMYYGSYNHPRFVVLLIGVVIFIVTMATAFMGYVLHMGTLSYWGSTAITNLLFVVTWIGIDFVYYLWGGFSVNDATVNRFFSIYFVFPFIVLAITCIQILTIHHNGSKIFLWISNNIDRLSFHPYFTYKDLITIFLYFIFIGYFVFYAPNYLGHSDL